MAVYGQMVLTTQGQALYAKTQTGTTLNFTRMQIGGGQLVSGQDPTTLTALITPIAYFNISSESTNGNTASIKGIFENTNINSSTYSCELGLFAQDPTAGEILYAYANAGTQGDTIPPISNGPLSKQYQINVAIGNATSITANVPSNTYIPTTELGVANGVATLDGTGKVPSSQLPSMNYISTSAEGVANGVATLDQNGQVPSSQLGNAPSPVKTSQQEIKITSTSQTVASHTPSSNGNYQVNLYLRVVTAATTVTVTVNWTDATGAQTNTMISAQSLSVGSHSLTPLFFNALATGSITVNVTVGTTNQVYASSSITWM